MRAAPLRPLLSFVFALALPTLAWGDPLAPPGEEAPRAEETPEPTPAREAPAKPEQRAPLEPGADPDEPPGDPSAEPPAKGGPPWLNAPPIELSVSAKTLGVLPTEAGPGRARVGVLRNSLELTAERWAGPIRLKLTLGFERSHYDFREPGDLDPQLVPTGRDPYDELDRAQVGFSAIALLSKTWSVQLFTSTRAGFERGAKLQDSIALTLFASVGYALSRELSLVAGLGAFTRIEERPLVVPVLGIRWRPVEWLTLEIRGPFVLATATFERWTLSATLGLDNRQYRLDDRRTFFAEHVVEDQRIALDVSARWRPTEWFAIGVHVGASLYQELRLRDRRGDSVETLRPHPTPHAAFVLEFRY